MPGPPPELPSLRVRAAAPPHRQPSAAGQRRGGFRCSAPHLRFGTRGCGPVRGSDPPRDAETDLPLRLHPGPYGTVLGARRRARHDRPGGAAPGCRLSRRPPAPRGGRVCGAGTVLACERYVLLWLAGEVLQKSHHQSASESMAWLCGIFLLLLRAWVAGAECGLLRHGPPRRRRAGVRRRRGSCATRRGLGGERAIREPARFRGCCWRWRQGCRSGSAACPGPAAAAGG